ncbi:MAG: DUF4350 domain-containing protein [Owenweeksia sp.]
MDRRNIALIILGLLMLFSMIYLDQPETSWVETFRSGDKQPYGGKALHELMEARDTESEIKSAHNTVYELVNEQGITEENLLIVASYLSFDQADWMALKDYVESGHTVLVASRSLGDSAETELGLKLGRRLGFNPDSIMKGNLKEPLLKCGFKQATYPSGPFMIPESAVLNYLEPDTSAEHKVWARNEDGQALFIQYPMGEGSLFVSSNPLLLTNIYCLDTAVSGFSAGLLSVFPEGENIVHIEYYQAGRMESSSPLRFILSQAPLRWAFYLTFITLVLFIVFEAKRKQRIIPIQEPVRNTSLEFTETLGQLYYTARKDHANIIRKRVQYFQQYLAKRYSISSKNTGEEAVAEMARRTGKDPEKLNKLLTMVECVKQGDRMGDDFLMKLEVLLYWFYSKPGPSDTKKK